MYHSPKTVGELKEILKDLPDETPVVRETQGYYHAVKQDVCLFVGDVERRWRFGSELDDVPDGSLVVKF